MLPAACEAANGRVGEVYLSEPVPPPKHLQPGKNGFRWCYLLIVPHLVEIAATERKKT